MALNAEDELINLLKMFMAYRDGVFDTEALVRGVHHTSDRLQLACFCDSELCCRLHQEHVNPHRYCILR